MEIVPSVEQPDCVFDAVDLKKEFDDGRVRALRGVSFRIMAGEFVSIIGTSGSGKSTLLKMLGAIDKATSGSLLYKGEPIAELPDPAEYRAREIGFIFQAFHLLPNFTAIENVQFPMFETDRPARERRDRAAELLDAVGLRDRHDHFPDTLSGGERQRVAIARSIANQPEVLLADEPTGNLDSKNAESIMDLIKTIQAERKMTVVLVTHDMAVARHAPRALRMEDGSITSDGKFSSDQ